MRVFLRTMVTVPAFLNLSLTTPSSTDALKGTMFNPQAQLGNQYRKGMVAKDTAGFNDWYRNSLLVQETTGTAAKTTGYTVNGPNQTGAAVTVQTGTTTFLKGDVITLAGCNRCHPETKADLGYLEQFVITANSGASATSLAISPSIVTTGATQNVVASPSDTGAVVKVGAGVSETYTQTIAFHPDAFTFVTADLIDVSKFWQPGDHGRCRTAFRCELPVSTTSLTTRFLAALTCCMATKRFDHN